MNDMQDGSVDGKGRVYEIPNSATFHLIKRDNREFIPSTEIITALKNMENTAGFQFDITGQYNPYSLIEDFKKELRL
jgi:hypothetical protein